MMIRKILQRASSWAHSLSHFGNLGRTAATRAFLRKERKKLLMKLGERAVLWVQDHPEAPAEVRRAVEQIRKLDALLSKRDFGGENGADFVPPPKPRGTRRRKS
ncbi:MAG: hypothetical protein IT573_02760 [Deltaproteobacteria bacterium]|nr:hypothetical protein [Deltaproteobacteria bacterium]